LQPPQRVDNGAVPLRGERREGEDRHPNADQFRRFGNFAHHNSPRPGLQRVEDRREGHTRGDDQQVGQRQRKDVSEKQQQQISLRGRDVLVKSTLPRWRQSRICINLMHTLKSTLKRSKLEQ
jgi:hypothetical protein